MVRLLLYQRPDLLCRELAPTAAAAPLLLPDAIATTGSAAIELPMHQWLPQQPGRREGELVLLAVQFVLLRMPGLRRRPFVVFIFRLVVPQLYPYRLGQQPHVLAWPAQPGLPRPCPIGQGLGLVFQRPVLLWRLQLHVGQQSAVCTIRPSERYRFALPGHMRELFLLLVLVLHQVPMMAKTRRVRCVKERAFHRHTTS